MIQKLRLWARSPRAERDLVRRAGGMLMQHIGLAGRCDCLTTRGEQGDFGYLLMLQTTSHVPHAIRVELSHYVGRKLKEMIRLDPSRLVVKIEDVDDAALARRPAATTARILAELRSANPTDEERRSFEMVQRMRAEVQQQRSTRRVDPDHLEVPTTDLGELSAV